MSFWDHLKPATQAPTAIAVKLDTDRAGVALQWDDGVENHVAARALRQNCPCAECVEEWSGRRTLDPESVSPDVRVVEVAPVGNYAVSFAFSDQHSTGIFNWSTLRKLGSA